MKFLATALLLALSVTAANASNNAYLVTKSVDGKDISYDASLPREQRNITLTITRTTAESTQKVLVASTSALVASAEYNDDPDTFTVPINSELLTRSLVRVTNKNGDDVPVAETVTGVWASLALADSNPDFGQANIRIKDANAEEQNFDFSFKDGETTKTVGDLTFQVKVSHGT